MSWAGLRPASSGMLFVPVELSVSFLFLTTWACLLLGFFLSRHLGLGGSFSVVPQEGLPELLGIRMLPPVFLRRAHCSLRLARRLIGFNTW
jgi:hypothetical protein